MQELSDTEISRVAGGLRIMTPEACGRQMALWGGWGALAGGCVGGFIGTIGGPLGATAGALLGAALVGGGSGAMIWNSQICNFNQR